LLLLEAGESTHLLGWCSVLLLLLLLVSILWLLLILADLREIVLVVVELTLVPALEHIVEVIGHFAKCYFSD